MNQLTIRGFDQELSDRIRELAEEEHLSLNQAALRLLRRGAGIGRRAERNVIGDSLDHLAGTWTTREEREFLKAIEPFEVIDRDFWR